MQKVLFLALILAACTPEKKELTLDEKLALIQSKPSVVNVLDLYKNQLYEVDCSEVDQLLYDIYEADQELRTTGEGSDDTDYNNLIAVLSIIKHCGFPTNKDLGSEESALAIPLVLQHQSNQDISSYYLNDIIKSADEGVIPKDFIAMMIDRQLMQNGFKQMYGSQIVNNQLYELEDPENVDLRRKEYGFRRTIEEYLDGYGLTLQEALSNPFPVDINKRPNLN